MHAAKYEKSERLQRVHRALMSGPKTTREIIQIADVCAVNSIAAELKQNGIPVRCTPVPGKKGVFLYSLEEQQ
ncbi:MAG: hypothetical protein K8I29_19730 [Alphaproteobacteria bacterium]|uniref:Uncharacterized protein n=1 Tax=Candidatus Nitrobium versatile TaxID=2884831 RepID=A0A953M3R9_9BACT|nr:hypothetical protein [Candidatus Nitrobium versatile]